MSLRDLVDPFPNLRQGSILSEGDLYHAMRCKYVMRNLLEGGPIAQPNFALIQAVPGYVCTLLNMQEGTMVLQHPPREFTDDRHQLTPAAVASAVACGDLLPTMYKPNRGAWGRGVTFIGGTPEAITLTTNHLPRQYQKRSESERLGRYLGDRIGAEVRVDASHHRAHFTIRAPPGEREMLLLDTLLLLGTTVGEQSSHYDPGMIESMLHCFKPGGRAYETRHWFMGNLRTGEFFVGKGKDGTPHGWAAQIGSNAEFAHVHQKDQANGAGTLTWERRYDPLFDYKGFTARERVQFSRSVDELLIEQFRHLAMRLQRAGISLTTAEVQGEFDLQWRFQRGKRFPTPALIEARVLPSAVYHAGDERSLALDAFKGRRIRVQKTIGRVVG